MAKNAAIQKRFDGGMAPDPKLGPPYSFAYARHFDFRKKPSQMTVLPKTVQVGQGTVVDLIQNSVMDLAGNIYFLGDTGYLYRYSTAGVWTVLAKLTDGNFGMSYRSDVDKLFLASSTTISEYSPVTNSPTIQVDKYAASASTYTGATLSGGTLTYPLKTVINESESDRQNFTSDIEPISRIDVVVDTPGTGDWTMTVHDAAHNSLGTSTVTNANINANRTLSFSFTPMRVYVKPNARTYHFHLTSTVDDGTVRTSDAGNLNSCDFTVYADRLIDTKNGMHPIQTFLQYECIGNGNYLAVWEPLSETPGNSEFLRHKLVFPAGLEVCGLAVWREYLAIATEKKTDSGTAQEGYIFFWDGLSSTYNFFLKVPEGSPYAVHEYKDVLYYEAGGAEYAYAGGQPNKIRTLPNTDSEFSDTTDTTITYPYMATVRRGVHLMGYPSYTTNTSIEHGAYSYGSLNKDFQESFGFNHTISTGTLTNVSGNLRLGHLKSYGDTLYLSWRDGSSYGIDKIDNTSDPYADATWQSLWFDNNAPLKEKEALYLMVTFLTLPSGTSLYLKYRRDRNGSWTTSDAFTSANTPKNTAKFPIAPTDKRFYEIQGGIDLVITGTDTPTITSFNLVYDDLSTEALL